MGAVFETELQRTFLNRLVKPFFMPAIAHGLNLADAVT
jgi:hypothetical protein